MDLRRSNLVKFLRGLFFADYTERASTAKLLPGASGATVASVASDGYVTTNTTTANGWFTPGTSNFLLVLASGFDNPGNNGLKKVSAVTSTKLSVSGLTAESSPPDSARLDLVGFEAVATGSKITMTHSTGAGTKLLNVPAGLGIKAGELIFVGGDATDNKLSNAQLGWVRVKEVDGTTLTLSITDFTPANASTGTKVQIFVSPRYIRNAPTGAHLRKYEYRLERRLGKDASDLEQAQYLTGAVADSMTMSLSTADKVTCSISFMCKQALTRKGSSADPTNFGVADSKGGIESLKTGAKVVKAPIEPIYNTSSNITTSKLYLVDNNKSLYQYLSDLTLTITNEIANQHAVGSQFAIGDVSGNFGVGLSGTAFFEDSDVLQTIQDNAEVGAYMCIANNNSGMVFDIPNLMVTTSDLGVSLNESVTVSVDTTGSESTLGHTMQWAYYDYLPDVAMGEIN